MPNPPVPEILLKSFINQNSTRQSQWGKSKLIPTIFIWKSSEELKKFGIFYSVKMRNGVRQIRGTLKQKIVTNKFLNNPV
jgi:hypothetical protein